MNHSMYAEHGIGSIQKVAVFTLPDCYWIPFRTNTVTYMVTTSLRMLVCLSAIAFSTLALAQDDSIRVTVIAISGESIANPPSLAMKFSSDGTVQWQYSSCVESSGTLEFSFDRAKRYVRAVKTSALAVADAPSKRETHSSTSPLYLFVVQQSGTSPYTLAVSNTNLVRLFYSPNEMIAGVLSAMAKTLDQKDLPLDGFLFAHIPTAEKGYGFAPENKE
ncbi:MAG: hypothetical protein AAGG48_31905 [Planctomycetota bacterium]